MFRARRFLLTPPVLVLLAFGGAGCGGGGKKDQVTAAELVQRADAICREERGTFARVQAHPPPSASVAADQTGELLQAAEKANSGLHDLDPPDELQARYERYLEARDSAVDQLKRGQKAAEDKDSAAYGAAQAALARDAPQRRKLADALGLKICSSSRAGA
jgi:hypothetical protein